MAAHFVGLLPLLFEFTARKEKADKPSWSMLINAPSQAANFSSQKHASQFDNYWASYFY